MNGMRPKKRRSTLKKPPPLNQRFKYHNNLIMHSDIENAQFEVFLPAFERNKKGKKMYIQRKFLEDSLHPEKKHSSTRRRKR